MFEYEMMNKTTGEVIFVYGYGLPDVYSRRPDLESIDWTVLNREYVD